MTDDVAIRDFQHLTISLSAVEYEVANILAFDPDATVPPGSLVTASSDDRPFRFLGSMMGLPAWIILAQACHPEGASLDAQSCFNAFITNRTSPVTPLQIGSRVRIRSRQRIGGDRFAGRIGTIVKSHFAGFYVRLDLTPRERTQKTELVETTHLESLDS